MSRKVLLMLAAIAVLSLIGCKKQTTAEKAQTPPSAGETAKAPGEMGKAMKQAAGATAEAQQQFVAGAEKTLTALEQQVQAFGQQQAQLPEQDREKVQQLTQQFNKELANAKASLDKFKSASPEASRDLKVAVDDAMSNLQNTYKQLQSAMQGQRQVSQEQP
jgi:ABC-type transporter Mla subunit MlaD